MSYNGYNYSHYFNSASQNNDRQGSYPSQSSNTVHPNHATSSSLSYRQQQTDIRGYTASQPQQWNAQRNSSDQAATNHWYNGGNGTSTGSYQDSTSATSGSGAQGQYMGVARRTGGSHLDTSALGSLAYASGLESSGVDSQPLQTTSRNNSDYNTASRRIQTPPARLVSPMHGSTTTALPNGNNHVRSGSTSSAQPQFAPSYRHAQQQLRTGPGHPQSVNTNHNPYQPLLGGLSADADAQSHHGRYTSSRLSSGTNASGNEARNSELHTQQARSLVTERRTSSPQQSQQAHSNNPLENHMWQTSSAYGTQISNAQANNVPRSHHSPESTARSVGSSAGKHLHLDAAPTNAEPTSGTAPQRLSQTNGPGQSWSNTRRPSNWGSSGMQDAPAQTERVRQHHLSQDQELRDSKSHSPQKSAHHDLQHPSMLAPSTAPITVDPSRVFNPYHQEYQRRKALADAEDARKDTRSSFPVHDERSEQPQVSTRADPQVGAPISSTGGRTTTPVMGRPSITSGHIAAPGETDAKVANSGLDSSDKEQMESEMKLMLEKMREYKAKDPSLFLQIWEQVKKGTAQMPMKTPTLPQAGLADQASSQIPLQAPSSSDGSIAIAPTDSSQLPSPSPTIMEPPVAWKPLIVSSPDLGKFPAMRRRRGAGRRSRLQRRPQSGPVSPSEETISSNQVSQAGLYQPPGQASVTASSNGVKAVSEGVQLNALPNSSNTTLPKSNVPAPQQDDRQQQSTLADVRPPSRDGTLPAEASSGTTQTAVVRPPDVPKHAFKASLQEQRDSPAGIPTDQSNHNSRVGIVWPNSKKTALATAAEIALTSTAANVGKSISIETIRALLDSNPSYIELCESFERRGFVFDRGHFARMLLAAVPDINSSTSAPSTMNATSNDPIEIDGASQHLSRAALAASANSGNRAMQTTTTADAAVSATGPSPKLTANGGLSAMSPSLDVGQPRRSEILAHSITVPPHLMQRGPGRPRKDGSPAQPRTGVQRRQPLENHGNSLGLSASAQTTSRSLPIDPALLATDRENMQRLGSHSDSDMHNHTQSATRSPIDQLKASGSRDTTHTVARPDLNGLSITQPNVNGSANSVGTDRNTGPDKPGVATQETPKRWLHNNLKWDPSRMWTKSSIQDWSRQEKPQDTHVTQVPPHRTARAKRDHASNLNANLPPQSYSSFSNNQEITSLGHRSKMEMALKRSFSDIVDLTQNLSGEEDNSDQRVQKRPRETGFGSVNLVAEDSLFRPSWVPSAPVISSGPRSGVDTPVTGDPMEISKFSLANSGPLSQKTALYMNVIKPLNKRDALRRSDYNAKTIARDVLIAAGRHQDMRPLNAHLDSLRRNFFTVEFGSDLATFDWELVDPTPPGNHGIGPDASIHDADDEDDGAAVFEQETTFASEPFQQRRAVMSTTDGGVEVFSSDVRVQRLGKGTLVKRQDQLRHNDAGHRARPAGHGHGGHANETPGRSEVTAPVMRSSTQLAGAGSGSTPAVRVEVSAPSVREVTSTAAVQDTNQNTTQGDHAAGSSEKKPRGRPPKHVPSSSTPSLNAQQSRSGSAKDDTDDDNGKKRRGRPPGSKNRTPQSSRGGAEGDFTVPTRPKSRGNTTPARSALRNTSTPLDDQPFAVIIDSPSRNTNFRRSESQRKRKSESQDPSRRTRGRPSAASRAEPTYKVYDCRWKDCKAELHNLETLRKHVRKIHRAKAAFGGLPCRWKGCGKISFVQDRKTGRHNRVHQELDFGTEDLWNEHMDKRHLEPFAWDLGDGPSAGPSDGPDTDQSDYLSDRKGRRITPQAISSGPQDALILPAKKKPLKAYNKTHGNKTESEKAQAILKALEHRKASVGPGIERGGCTLVTPARRAALRDSEFAVQVLEEDDDSS